MSAGKLEPTVKRRLMLEDSIATVERELRAARIAANRAARALQYLKVQLKEPA